MENSSLSLLVPFRMTGPRKHNVKIGKDFFAIHFKNKFLETFKAAAGIDGPDIGADTASDNEIDGDILFFQSLNGPDMRPTARGPATQDQTDCFSL